MSELSRQARRAMRAKIHRITKGESGKVDASDYGPEEVLNANVKTGMRPISRRAYKKGGKVVASEGKDAVKHAGKKARSKPKHLTVDALVNRNYKDANEAREGVKHVGGLKTGGRANKNTGGPLDAMGGDLYGMKNNPNPKRATALKKGGRAKKFFGGAMGGGDMGGGAMGLSYGDAQNTSLPGSAVMGGGYGGGYGGGQYASLPGSGNVFKSGGRAKKQSGGGFQLDPTKSGNAKINSTTPEFKAAAAKAEAARQAAAARAQAQRDADAIDRGNRMQALEASEEARMLRTPRPPRKSGGKAHMDEREDRALIGKMVKKGALTGKKHGGLALDGEYQGTRPKGGRIAKRDGGSLAGLEMNSGGRAKKGGKGKTNINIVISTGRGQPQDGQMPGGIPPRPAGIPIAIPPQGAGAPPMPAGGPPPMPMPPMGGAGPMPAPMPRKAGGRTYRSYKDMDAGAGSGLGRLEKTEIQKHKR